MTETHDEAYVARSTFQSDLDRRFPEGAVCAVLPVTGGRLQAAGRVEATGRLLCSDARRSGGGWEYEILIDTRTRADRPATEHRLWIGPLSRHRSVEGLWEAVVRDGGVDERLLRLNAAAPASVMPRPGGRAAVTRAHEAELFLEGIPS